MKVPTWATVIGALMLLFGGCGVLNNIQKINTPRALDQSADMMSGITQQLEKAVKEGQNIEIADDSLNAISNLDSSTTDEAFKSLEVFGESFGNMINFSDYYKVWIVRIGILGVIVSIFYAIAGVILIIGKRYALKLVYAALGLSMAALIFQIVVLAMDKESGMIAGMSNIGAYFMVFINIILLVVVLASDKSFFYQDESNLT